MMVRAASMIGKTSSRRSIASACRKRNIWNTIVRAATAATTTGVSSGAFLLAHNQHGTVHSLRVGAPICVSSVGRSHNSGIATSFVGSAIGTSNRGGAQRNMASSPSELQEQDSSGASGDQQPLEALCSVTLRASEAVTPAVEALYRSIGTKKTVKTKADDSVFTIADGLVQCLLTEILFGQGAMGDIVGEEDCAVNLTQKPYTVDDLEVPKEFETVIEEAIEGVTKARAGWLSTPDDEVSKSLYRSLTAFIDPIDGTREFSTQKGEQCTICVGFADSSTGKPVAGVVYRPLSSPQPTWATGAKGEAYVASSLLPNTEETTKGSLLTTNGRISPFLESVMTELGYDRAPSGGAGNKMLMLLEGRGTAYIQDRGVSRWDTCGAQAVLEAHGGILCRLDRFLEDCDGEASYTYRQTDKNLDFLPGKASLTKYNAAKGVDVDGMAMDPSEVKSYANLCGLVALGKVNNTEESRAKILNGLKKAAEISPPAFD